MGQKSNIRSFRFSDEVAGILEGFQGRTLNEKFENLVLYCFWNRKKIDQDIAKKQAEYKQLCKKVDDKRDELMDLDTLQRDRNKITSAILALSLDIVDYHTRLKNVTQDFARAADLEAEKCVTNNTPESVTQITDRLPAAALTECVTKNKKRTAV